jgi:ABC-type glycerol-3-phosphate transport system substrate-binding protein
MKKKANAIWISIIAAAALTIAACSNSTETNSENSGSTTSEVSNTGADSAEQVTINFLNTHAGKYEALISAFESQNPNIKVENQSVPFDELVSQIQARLSNGDDSLDVIAVDTPRVAGMVADGFLTDETASLGSMQETFSSVGIDSVTVDDKVWAYPMWTSDNFLFYNKKVLESAGVAIPGSSDADRMTFEQVLADSKKIVESGTARYGFGIEQPDRYYALQPVAMGMGTGTGLTGDDNLTPALDTPEWQQFGEWYASTFEDGLSPRGIDSAGMTELLVGGDIGYLLANPVIFTELKERLGDDWGLSPHPYFEGKQIYTPTDSWAFGISAFSAHKEASRTFVQFMTMNPVGVAAASQQLRFPPVATTAMPEYLDSLKELAPDQTATVGDLLEVDGSKYAVHRPVSVGFVQFENAVNKAFSDIRNGSDVAKSLATAQSTLERQLGKLQK